MTKPYVPFYKPLGMSDETYRQEVHKAEQRLAEWEQMQEEAEYDQLREALSDGKTVQICTINQNGKAIDWQDVDEINEAFAPNRYRIKQETP